MKKPNRQTLLIGGAVLCLLISVFALLPSGSDSGGGEDTSSNPASMGDGVQNGSPLEPANVPSSGAPPANPEFYQRARQQLLAVVPEHQEPFATTPSLSTERAGVGATPSPSTGRAGVGTSSLPVLPLTLQPAPHSPLGESRDGGQSQPARQEPAPPLPLGEGRGEGQSNSARLRGRIYDHAKRQTIVLFELNGTLLRASNEPNAEWRIVRIAPRQITVRNGKQTLILEVPYAP
jgi:hypothetical protein